MTKSGKIVTFQGFWSKYDVLKNPDSLFVFRDNDVGKGCGGQAIIRGLPNAIGILTKKYPSNNASSFYTDNEYIHNITKITIAIIAIIKKSVNYKKIIFPENRFGTGLADLPNKAPKTFKYLLLAISELERII